jgi:hypothetical protein
MSLEPLPRSIEPINVLTAIFLKTVYFLDTDLLKCLITGVFKNRDNSLGILLKGRRGFIFWSLDILNEFFIHFNSVTLKLEGKQKYHFGLDSGEGIKVVNVFGKQHVFLNDREHTLALNNTEWTQFINCLPAVYTHLGELALFEHSIKNNIQQILNLEEKEEENTIISDLPSWISKRLIEDVLLYKRYPGGGGGK